MKNENSAHIPRKRFGQNFLKDPVQREFIVNSAYIVKTDTVLEIGPGRGELTGIIAVRCPVTAVEIDRDLVRALKHRFSGNDRVEIIESDILAFDLKRISSPRFKVIGNIPYYITTPIIFKLLKERHRIDCIVLTIQKEVAERLAAVPGNKDYGVLTIMTGMYAKVDLLKIIPASAFFPAPKVDSAVIKLTPLEFPRVNLKDFQAFESLVKIAFQQRRKNIRNALLRFGCDKAEASRILSLCNIDENARPENVSIEDFGRLSELAVRSI